MNSSIQVWKDKSKNVSILKSNSDKGIPKMYKFELPFDEIKLKYFRIWAAKTDKIKSKNVWMDIKLNYKSLKSNLDLSSHVW